MGPGRDADVRAGTRMPIHEFLDNSDGPIIDDPESVFLPKPIHGGVKAGRKFPDNALDSAAGRPRRYL